MEIEAGRWRVRLTDVAGAPAALALRARIFRGGSCDRDAFDADARHLVIVGEGGDAVACARLSVQVGDAVNRGYSARFYDLSAFARTFPRALEVGRIGFAPGPADPDVPQLVLAAVARVVEEERVTALHGCTSFPLADACLGGLARHVAPSDWAPTRIAPETRALSGPDGSLPPLLRSYLSLGARVSDHAVVDRDLGTVHVHTALPVADIPRGRARLLSGMLAPV